MRRDDLELMQYADGELGERDREAFAAQLESDADARAKLEALGQIRELVAGNVEHHADHVSEQRFAAMWRDVSANLGGPPQSVWARLGAWFDRYRGHVFTGVASAGAVAAIALVIRSGGADAPARPSTSIEVLPAAMRTAPVVEALDTPEGTGTVMNFEDEDGHTTVIWVTPADTVEGI